MKKRKIANTKKEDGNKVIFWDVALDVVLERCTYFEEAFPEILRDNCYSIPRTATTATKTTATSTTATSKKTIRTATTTTTATTATTTTTGTTVVTATTVTTTTATTKNC